MLDQMRSAYAAAGIDETALSGDFRAVRASLESALEEIRVTSAGLRLPEIEAYDLAETILRSIRDFKLKTHCSVEVDLADLPTEVEMPIKITLYRVIQEALANSYRHAAGKGIAVRARQSGNDLGNAHNREFGIVHESSNACASHLIATDTTKKDGVIHLSQCTDKITAVQITGSLTGCNHDTFLLSVLAD